MGVRADYSMITLFSFTLAFTLFKLFNKVMACSNAVSYTHLTLPTKLEV